MITNYCNSNGLMSVCEMINDVVGQQHCKFSRPASTPNRTEKRYCMHLGRAVEDHCDSSKAQWDAKCGKKKEVEPLNEAEIFDITNKDTYPEYVCEGSNLYL